MVRTSLSLIILAMVQNPTKKKGVDGGIGSRCYQVNFSVSLTLLTIIGVKVADIGNATNSGGGGEEEGELDWDNVQVGFVFSSFSWGYMTTQVSCSNVPCIVQLLIIRLLADDLPSCMVSKRSDNFNSKL